MHNDSLETLVLRHYGATAPAPADLEQRLVASVRHQVQEQRWQRHVASRIRQHRVSRRRVVRWVAVASAGVGALSVALGSLEAALSSQDTAPSVYS